MLGYARYYSGEGHRTDWKYIAQWSKWNCIVASHINESAIIVLYRYVINENNILPLMSRMVMNNI